MQAISEITRKPCGMARLPDGTPQSWPEGSKIEPGRILVAEDEPACQHWLSSVLVHYGFEVEIFSDGREARDRLLSGETPKIAILDWMLPGLDGLSICQDVREHAQGLYRYLILLTAKDQKEDLLQGFRSGADDYLTKPVDEAELVVRLRAGMRILRWQTELLEARKELEVHATRDTLTDLWNRRMVTHLLEREFNRGIREKTPTGVAILDIDHFKSINDQYGHPVGDEVIREVARRIAQTVRPYDIVGRYGGEEFLIVLPGCEAGQVRRICERVRIALVAQPVTEGSFSIPVTASIGFAIAPAGVSPDISGIVNDADRALYRAKAAGRNRVEFATE
jgi:two-component system, cell cycle response regulator